MDLTIPTVATLSDTKTGWQKIGDKLVRATLTLERDEWLVFGDGELLELQVVRTEGGIWARSCQGGGVWAPWYRLEDLDSALQSPQA